MLVSEQLSRILYMVACPRLVVMTVFFTNKKIWLFGHYITLASLLGKIYVNNKMFYQRVTPNSK